MKQPSASRWTPAQIARIKPLIFILCLAPAGRWVWLGSSIGLGANPQQYLILSSGLWALIALLITLAITPLRRLLNQPALVRVRRMFGLFAFFYTVLHILGWAVWERNASLYSMWQDVLERPFITVGVIASVPLLALAITSTKGWMRRLGAYWKTLHRTIYVITALSVWHFWMVRAGKNSFSEPSIYALILGVLLLVRVFYRVIDRRGSRR